MAQNNDSCCIQDWDICLRSEGKAMVFIHRLSKLNNSNVYLSHERKEAWGLISAMPLINGVT